MLREGALRHRDAVRQLDAPGTWVSERFVALCAREGLRGVSFVGVDTAG